MKVYEFSREIICKNLGFVCGPICVSQLSVALGTLDHGYIKFYISALLLSHFQLTTMTLSSLDHVKYKHNNKACNGLKKSLVTQQNLNEENKRYVTQQLLFRKCLRNPQKFVDISAAQSMSVFMILTILMQ